MIDWIVPNRIPRPAEIDTTFGTWFKNNCTIFGWFFNSVEAKVYELFVFYETIDLLWTTLTEMYSKTHNEVKIYELYQELSQATQGTMSVTSYFGYVKKRWEEFCVYFTD